MESKTLKVGCISTWQAHGKDFARKAAAYPDCVVAAVWDEDPQVCREWAAEMGCRAYTNLDDLLADADIGGVIITSGTVQHRGHILAAVAVGKHVFVEKPAFATNADAHAVRDIVLKSDIKFMMSDPMVTPPLMKAKAMVAEGFIGQPILVRVRSAHGEARYGTQPPDVFRTGESGGGAMIDMGCHAVHMLDYLCGRPLRAHCAMAGVSDLARAAGVDDNTVAVYEYPDGLLATAETGWVTDWYQNGFSILGARGCILYQQDALRYHVDGGQWTEVPAEDWPAPRTYPMRYWIDCVLNGTPVQREDIHEAVRLTEMITAAYRAAQTGVDV